MTVHLQQVEPLINMRSWQRNSSHHPNLSSSTALQTDADAYFHPKSVTLRYACACNILAGGHANLHPMLTTTNSSISEHFHIYHATLTTVHPNEIHFSVSARAILIDLHPNIRLRSIWHKSRIYYMSWRLAPIIMHAPTTDTPTCDARNILTVSSCELLGNVKYL